MGTQSANYMNKSCEIYVSVLTVLQ